MGVLMNNSHKTYAYDTHALELAKHYLQDELDLARYDDSAVSLAQCIQRAVEEWFKSEVVRTEPV
jgi:hypothetical protein